MDHYWEANALTTAPPVPSESSGTYPTDGNPVTVTPPTTPGAWWYHQITEEIRNAIVKLGGAPDFTQVDQLANALVASIGSAVSGIADQLARVAYSGSYNDLTNQPAIQPPLGFTPVQQGGGIGQGADKIYIGWDGGGLRATIDSTDEGHFVFETELQADVANLQNNINNVANSVSALQQQIANMGGAGLGSGQSWQNMTGSRAQNTGYTNSTGRPIALSLDGGSNNIQVSINGAVVSQSSGYMQSGAISSVFAVIPASAVYSVTGGFSAWWELR